MNCPCCGLELPSLPRPRVCLDTNTIVFRRQAIALGPQLAEIALVLSERMPAPVQYGTIIERVWGVMEEELTASRLKMQVSLLRQQIRPLNLGIVTYRSRGYAMMVGGLAA
jgi:DNA-binding response OmpR family regulator